MQEPFDGETFSYSLVLVLCNRLLTVCVAITMLTVRRRRTPLRPAAGRLLRAPPLHQAQYSTRCGCAPRCLKSCAWTTRMTRTCTHPAARPPAAAVQAGPAAGGARLQLRCRLHLQRGGHLLPVRGAEACVLPGADARQGARCRAWAAHRCAGHADGHALGAGRPPLPVGPAALCSSAAPACHLRTLQT